MMDREKGVLDDLKNELVSEFMGHVIPFWQGLSDKEYGGFYGLLDDQLNLDKKADKGAILNSRILWFFSSAYTFFEEESLLYTAREAYHELKNCFYDNEKGGVYWSVTYDGNPSDDSKHTYNQAFAIYGLASYYEAAGDSEALDMALELFNVIESKCCDDIGYLEAFSREFEPVSNEKLADNNGTTGARTMNTLLHVMEAYTELYRVNENPKVKEKLLRILKLFREKVYDPEGEKLYVFFDMDYNSTADIHSYGHDIEVAWLIDRTLDVLKLHGTEYDLSDITDKLTKKIYDIAYDGSVAEENHFGTISETRVWWVECEAMIGFMNAYQKDQGETKYLDAIRSIWDFIVTYIVDKREGSEWYFQVDKDGKPIPGWAIASLWKCPYHNGRMFIEMIKRMESL